MALIVRATADSVSASANSRYTTASVVSAVFIGWEAVAQYLGAASIYLATVENPPAVPTVLFGLLTPLAIAAIALWRSESIARLVVAIPLIGSWRLRFTASAAASSSCFGQTGACLAIRAAGGDWRRCDGHRCCRRGCAVGTERNWRA
jgi:hypothetical protein